MKQDQDVNQNEAMAKSFFEFIEKYRSKSSEPDFYPFYVCFLLSGVVLLKVFGEDNFKEIVQTIQLDLKEEEKELKKKRKYTINLETPINNATGKTH